MRTGEIDIMKVERIATVDPYLYLSHRNAKTKATAPKMAESVRMVTILLPQMCAQILRTYRNSGGMAFAEENSVIFAKSKCVE